MLGISPGTWLALFALVLSAFSLGYSARNYFK